MPKGRLVFDGDNLYTEKDARIYKLKSSVSSKIDAIPGVVDSLDSTSSTDALSANMGRQLQDQINSLSGTGKFLSTWDCTTGLPGTNPQEDPYTYKVGDYYVVSIIGSTNYKPHGGTYTQGVPSTTVELETVGVNDKYYFDGADWIRIPDTAIQISIDSALSTTSTNAVENRAIANAINTKQDTIPDLNTIRSGAASGATALQKLDNISELTNNIGYQTAGDVTGIVNNAISTLAPDGVGTGVLTLQKNATTVDTFSANATQNKTINITVPTTVAELSDASDYATKADVAGDLADYVQTSDLGAAATSNDYNDLDNKPMIPTVNNAALVIQKNGTNVATFTANAAAAVTANISVPTTVAELSDASDYATKTYVDDVTDNIVHTGATAPSSPTEGMVWYDTTNDQLKVYDGSNWDAVENEYNAGEGILIGTVQDYSAMQGPALKGYHIPQNSEWTAIIEIWKSLGGGASAGNDFLATLKMPKLGYLQKSDGAVNNENNYGYYWTCTSNTSITVNHSAYYLQIYNNNITIKATEALVVPCGMPVRCFKDTPVTPDSSWTKLYGTSIESGGIFHNSSFGLISLSSDGETWITIQDKNIGATQVYNSGDTKTKYNCGGYLQRGNNYVFEYGETLTTSSTQVDASNYGPGNYYSSSTFITTSSSPNDRSSVQNDDLWGGETGVVTYDNTISVDKDVIGGIVAQGIGTPFGNLELVGTVGPSSSQTFDLSKYKWVYMIGHDGSGEWRYPYFFPTSFMTSGGSFGAPQYNYWTSWSIGGNSLSAITFSTPAREYVTVYGVA